MKKIRLVIIGLNLRNKEHIKALKSLSLIDVVGVCNINIETAKEISEIFGKVDYFEKYNDAISILNPDALFLSLPHDQYFKIIKFATQRNIHLLKEKPFSLNLSEAKEIVHLFQQTNSKLMLISQRRFHETYIHAESYLKTIGFIKRFEAVYTFNKPTEEWRRISKRSGGGVIIDSGYHIIDILNHYFGVPESVICETKKLSSDETCETEDFASIKFNYPDGMTGSLILSRIDDIKKEEVLILGERGKMIIRRDLFSIEMYNPLEKTREFRIEDNFENAYTKQHSEFFSSLSTDATRVPSVAEGMSNSVVIEACYRSALNKSRPININELIVSEGVVI